MPDYTLGKIYKITGNGKVYIGSTCRPMLCQRMSEHRGCYKRWFNGKDRDYLTSFECVNDPNCYIELLETYPCNTKDELTKCEGKWIREIKCVNHRVEGRTRDERRLGQKEKISKQQKEYNEINKEKQQIQRKQRYEKSKDKLREKFICECGGKYAHADKLKHERTIKHQSFAKTNFLIEIQSEEFNSIIVDE